MKYWAITVETSLVPFKIVVGFLQIQDDYMSQSGKVLSDVNNKGQTVQCKMVVNHMVQATTDG